MPAFQINEPYPKIHMFFCCFRDASQADDALEMMVAPAAEVILDDNVSDHVIGTSLRSIKMTAPSLMSAPIPQPPLPFLPRSSEVAPPAPSMRALYAPSLKSRYDKISIQTARSFGEKSADTKSIRSLASVQDS